MEIFDGTVIAPAAPYIADDFGVHAVEVNVAIIAYVLTLAVLIPVSGWLTDRYGTRRVFMTAIAIFTLASCGCAVAVNLPILTAMRIGQGMGGAMMVPVGGSSCFAARPGPTWSRPLRFSPGRRSWHPSSLLRWAAC